MCGVMCRTRVIFQWEGKHMQYPEDIVSKGPVGRFKVSLLGAALSSFQDMTAKVQRLTTLSSNEDDGAMKKNEVNASLPSRFWQQSDLC